MAYLLIVLLATICISMFFVKREIKFILLLVNYICFTAVTLPGVPFGNSIFIVPICFFISEIRNKSSVYRSLSLKIKKMMYLMIFASIICLVYSPHYNDSLFNTTRFFIAELVSKYFVIAYAYVCIKDSEDIYKSVNFVFKALIVLTFFALLNIITTQALFINSLGIDTVGGDRLRVQAMFANAFCYGYISVVLLFFAIFAYNKKMLTKRKYIISLLCCIFGIITCGSRTVLITGFASYIFYIIFTQKLSKKIYSALVIVILFAVSYNFIPSVQEKIDQTLSVFTDSTGSQVGGSNLEMRQTQYLTTFFYIKDNPFFGMGKDFFYIDLGWSDVVENGSTDRTDLAGLEGVMMSLLLERGFVGVLFYFVFYVMLFSAFLKYRKYDKQTCFIGISLLVAYMLFANSNGELLSVGPTLLVCGALLHILETEKRTFIQSVKSK